MRHLDLFSGIGGFALAVRWMGWETVGFVEIDPWCQRVLARNFPSVPIMGDVKDVRGDEFGPVDLVTGGYPCQPFSVAGQRRGAADDRHVWPEMRRVIDTARPRVVLAENVAGHVTMGLDTVLAEMESDGYTARAIVVPACAVDAPHRRDRVWLMAHADSNSEPVVSQHENSRLRELGTRANVADATGEGSQGRAVGRVQQQFATKGGEDVPHAASERQPGQRQPQYSSDPTQDREGQAVQPLNGRERRVWIPEPAVGGRFDGVSAGLDGVGGLDGQSYWENGSWEDGVARVANAIPRRGDRLRGLGNAIVPQVAYEILRCLP